MESKKVHEVLDRMLANLNCPICLDLMKTPMVTKCEHSFCKHCILATLGTKTKVPCPLCKEQVTKRSLKPQETMDGIVGAVRSLITAYEMDKDAIWSPVKGPPVQLDISMTPETSNSQPRTTNKMKIKDSKTMRKNIRNTRYGKKKITAPGPEIIFLDDSTSESSRGSALKSHLNIRDGFPNVTLKKSSRKRTRGKASNKRTNDEVEQEDDRQAPIDNHRSSPIKDILDGISQNPTQGRPSSPRHKKGNTSTESVAVVTESVSVATDSVSVTENLQTVSQNQKKSELINVFSYCELGAQQQASSEKEVEPSDGLVPLDVKKQVEKLLQCIEVDNHEQSLCRKSKGKSNNRVNNALEFVRTHLKEGLSSLDGSGQDVNAEAKSVARTVSSLDDIDVQDVPGYKSNFPDTSGDNGTKGNKKAEELSFAPSLSSKSSELDVFIPRTYSKKTQGQATKSQFVQLQNKQITSSEKVKKWMQTLVQDSPGDKTGRALKYLESVQSTPSSDATILVGEEKKSEEQCSIEDVNDDDTTDEIAIHASFCNESESDDNFDVGNVGEDVGSIEGPKLGQKDMVSKWEDVNENIVIVEPDSVKMGVDMSKVIIPEDEPNVPDSPLHKPAVAQRRRIFKSRPSAATDPTPSEPQCNPSGMTIYKYGESQEDMDPYGFQMSQRTPKAKGKKSRSRSRGKEVKVKEVKVKGAGKGKENDGKGTSRLRSKDTAGSEANEAVPGERCVPPSTAGTKSARGKSKGGRVKRVELSGRLGQVRRVQSKGHADISLFDLDNDTTCTSDHEMDMDAGEVMVVLEPAGEGLPVSDVTTGSNECESQDNLLITGKATSPWAALQQEVKQYTRKSRSRSRGKKKLIIRSDEGVQEDAGEDRTDGVGKAEVSEVVDVPEIKNLAEKISDAESFELDCMTFSQQIRDEEEVRRTLVTEKDKRLSTLEKSEREKMKRKKSGKKGMGDIAGAVGNIPKSDARSLCSPFVVPETQMKLESVGASPVQKGVNRTDVDLSESSQFKVPLPKVSKLKSVVKVDLVGNSEKAESADVVILVSDDEEAVEMTVPDSNDVDNDDIRDGEGDLDVVGISEIQDDANSNTENVEQDQSVDEFPSSGVQVVAETPLLALPRLKKIDSPVKIEGEASDWSCTPTDVEMDQDANASSIQVIAETPLIAGPQFSGSPVTSKRRRADRASLPKKNLRTEDADVREETVPYPRRSRRSTSMGVTPEKCLEGKDTDAKKGSSVSLRRSKRSKSEMATTGTQSTVDHKTLVVTDNDLVKRGCNAPCSPFASNDKIEADCTTYDPGTLGESEFEFGVQDSASVIADTMESLGGPVEKRKRKTRRLKPLVKDKETMATASANGKNDMAEKDAENRVTGSAVRDVTMFELGVQDSVSVIADTMESFGSPIEKKKRKPGLSKLVKDDESVAGAGAIDGALEKDELNDVIVIAETVESIESSLEKIGSKIRGSRIYDTGEIGDDARLDKVKEVNENCPRVFRSDENETRDGSAKIVEETQVSLEADKTLMQSSGYCGERGGQSERCDSGKESVVLVDDTPLIVQDRKEEIPGEVLRSSVGSLSSNSGSVTEKESDTESIELPSGQIEYEDYDPSIQRSPVRAAVEELGDVKLLSGTMDTEESLSMLQQKRDGAITKGSPCPQFDLDSTLDAKNLTKRTVLSWSDSDDEIIFRKPKRKTFSLDTSPFRLTEKSCPAINEPNSLFHVGQSLGECLREIYEEADNVPVEERTQQTSAPDTCGVQDVDGATEQTVPESNSGLQGLTHVSDSAKSSRHEMSGQIGKDACLDESLERFGSRGKGASKVEKELPLSSSSSKSQSLSSSRSQSGNSDVNTTGEIVPATPSASYSTTQPIKLDALLINQHDKSPVDNTGKPEKRSRLSRRGKKRSSDPPGDADVSSKQADDNRESSAKLTVVAAEGKESEEKEESCKLRDTPQAPAEGKQRLFKKRGCKSRDTKVSEADVVKDGDLENGHVVVESYAQFLKEVQNEEQVEERTKQPSESPRVEECPELEDVGSCQNSKQQEGDRRPKFGDDGSCKNSVEQEQMDDNVVEGPLKITPYFNEEDSDVEDDLDLLPSLPSANVGVNESEDERCMDVKSVDDVNSHKKNSEKKLVLKSDGGEIPYSAGIGIRLGRDDVRPDGANKPADVAVKCSVQDYESNFADMNEVNSDDGGEKALNTLSVDVQNDEIVGSDLSEADPKLANENEMSSGNDDLIPKTPLLQSRLFRKRGVKITKSIKNASSMRCDLVDHSSEDDNESKTKRKSPKHEDSQPQKASSGCLEKGRASKEQRTLNDKQKTLNVEQSTSEKEQTSSMSEQTNSQKGQKNLESDRTRKIKKLLKDDQSDSEKDYSYLNTDKAVARVYQNYYDTIPEVLLKHIKDETVDSSSQDCEVVKVEPAPSVESDDDDDNLTADSAHCSADSGDENIPDAVSTQGSCRTMNTTTSSEILPTQMREELEAEMAEIKAQMEAKRALMNDMSSERIDADDPDENQSDADSDEDIFDGPTPPPSPPSPNTSRTKASLNPSLTEHLQVLSKYRTRRTPDKHKDNKKTPVKSRTKTSQNVSKNMKTDDSNQCSDNDIVILETPQKKIRRRIRCVSDSSSSDDDFENFIQKEKDSQKLPIQSWETLGFGKHGTQNDHSQGIHQKLPDLGTELCSQRRFGSSGGQSQSGRGGLKLPKRTSDDVEDECSKGSALMPGLKESDNKEKDGNFPKPTSAVSQSSRRLSSQFGSPCVIPDSVENVDKHEVALSQSQTKDRLLGVSRKTMLESVSSSAETQEPSESVPPVRRDSVKITDKEKEGEKGFDRQNARCGTKGIGVKRKGCGDQFPNDEMILDADVMWNEDEQDCDNSSLSDAGGHVPKRQRQTTLEMSPVVYKTYDLGSQHLLKSLSAVPYVKTNVKRAESSLASDVHLGDSGRENNQNIRHSELKCCDDEGQSPSRFGLNSVGSVGLEISPLAKTDTRNNSPRPAPSSVGKSSRKQSPCVENFTGRQSPKVGSSEKYDSQSSVVEIRVEDAIKPLSPKHTSVNVKQNLQSPHTQQGVLSECTTPKSVKQTPDFYRQRTTPISVMQTLTTPVKQMTTSVKQTPTSVKQTPTSVKQTTTPKSVKQVITPKSLEKTSGILVDKENQLKRKAEAGGEGLDDVDGHRKRVASMPREGPRSSPQVRQLMEQMVEKQQAGAVSMSVSSPARAPLPMRRGRTFVVSGLNQTMKDVMTNFIESFGFIYSSKFSEKTTHVVVQTVEGQPCVCERTLKYFLGIAGRCWVVSLNWMIESVQQGVCLPEDDFEIHGDTVNGPNHNGPFRARNAKRLLLDRFEIYCHGQFTGMPISDTKLLILMLGAKLVNHPKEFTDNPRCFIIAEPDRTLKEQSYYDRLKQKFSAEVVSREWLLDNVAQYKIQNPRLYSLCENALTNNME